jgi:hypothetical protein
MIASNSETSPAKGVRPMLRYLLTRFLDLVARRPQRSGFRPALEVLEGRLALSHTHPVKTILAGLGHGGMKQITIAANADAEKPHNPNSPMARPQDRFRILPDGIAGSVFQFGGTAEARGLDIILKIPDPTGRAPGGKLTLTLPRENDDFRDLPILTLWEEADKVNLPPGERPRPERVYTFQSRADADIRLHAPFTYHDGLAGAGVVIPGSLPVGSEGFIGPLAPPHYILLDPLTSIKDDTPSRYTAGCWYKKVADRRNNRYLIFFNNPGLRPDGSEFVIPLELAGRDLPLGNEFWLQATAANPGADRHFLRTYVTLRFEGLPSPGSLQESRTVPNPLLVEEEARIFGFLQ